MNRVIETFSEFKTEHFTENWVQKVWTLNGFTSHVPFPSEFEVFLEEINICTPLNDFNEALRDWFRSSGLSLTDILESDSSNTDSSNPSEQHMNWQSLIDEGIDYKPIICILGTLILRFIDEPSNSTYFKEAMFAIRLYSYMIAIPGSHICQIFNSTLYSHVVAVIRICCEQIDNTGISRGKSVKRKKNGNDDDIDVGDSENSQLNCDKAELMLLASDFLANLKLIFENKKMKMDESSLNLTIQILMMITRLEKYSSTLLANNVNSYPKKSISHLASKSFTILLNLSTMLHSDPAQSVKLIMKSILPIFLINESGSLGLGAKEGSVVRLNFTYFLKMLLEKVGECAYDALNILVQRICVTVPDRAEMRLKASLIVLDILRVSPPDLQAEEIYSIVFMSHMAETKIRLLTLEIISKLLLEADAISLTQLPQKYAAVTNDEFLLAVILYRCQDMTTSISTKALSYLDQIICSVKTNKRAKKLVDKIFVEPYVEAKDPEAVPDYRREIFDTQRFLSNEEQFLDDCELNPLPGVKVILDMLVYFSQEDKVFVKKSARQTLASIFLNNRIWIKMDLLLVFLVGCDDSSVLVRKTMSQILTDLLIEYPNHQDLIVCWVEGVTPMIADEEAKAQEKVIEHFCKIILLNIVYYAHTTSVVSRLPWLVMKEILSQGKLTYLHYAIGKWVLTNAVRSKTLPMIYSHIDHEYNDVAWCLLVSFSQFMDLPNVNIIYEYYQSILPDLDAAPHSQIVLETLYYTCANMNKDDRDDLFMQLEKGLNECSTPLKLIARSRDICEQILTLRAGKKTNSHNLVIEWSDPKIKAYLQMIEAQIGKDAPPEIHSTELLIKHIFMVGEFASASPKSVSKNDIKLLQNLLLSPRKRDADAWKGRVSNAVKAVAILTLVKLILQKEDTASGIMPIFREILSYNSVDATIQVNTIIGMCDLCSRYTTLVERYFTYICKCFNSPHEKVRKTVLVCVMKRIREEYVKLRPYILYPMLTMILDKSDEIKRILATFINIDLRKRNNALETFYTGLFFFLNNSKFHRSTSRIPEDLRVTFSFTDNPEKRSYIYTYVLDKLADTPRRLLVCKKIVNEIMDSVANETLKLDEKMENILVDAFNILIDNERKISEAITKTKRGNTEETDDIEEMSEPNRAPAKSSQGQGVVNVTEALRLSEASEIIPVIIKLRLLLKKHKSKCLTNLMTYMCELMRNFKNEITDLLGGEGDLKAEIEYTLRQMEQEEERKRQEAIETIEAAEQADSNEARAEDDGNAIPVITTNPEEICEQLQSLIVQLSRCDGADESARCSENTQPIMRLSKCNEVVETNTCSSPGSKSSARRERSSVPPSPRTKSTITSPAHSKSSTPTQRSVPPSPLRGSVPASPRIEIAPLPPSPRRESVPSSSQTGSVPLSPCVQSPPPVSPKPKSDRRRGGTKRKKRDDIRSQEAKEEERHVIPTTSTPIVPRAVKKAPSPEPVWDMEEESINLGIQEIPNTKVEGVERFSSDED